MAKPEPEDFDPDLRLRLSEPMLGQSLRPVLARPWQTEAASPSELREAHEQPGQGEEAGEIEGTRVMSDEERESAGDRDAAMSGVALPRQMTGGQEWVLLPLPEEPHGVIGVGGQGIVFSYVQRELGREVAVKTLRGDRWSYETIEDLVREACVTARLEHPNIVPVHYLHLPEHDGDSPYWVMKRIRGKALTEHLPGGSDPWPFDRLLEVFHRMLDAVAFAHSKGIVHRDLKPDNVLVGEFGEVQVTDWGLAVAVTEEGARGAAPLLGEGRDPDGDGLPPVPENGIDCEAPGPSKELVRLNEDVRSGRIGALLNTSAGGRAGTPAYMAPEQLELTAGKIDERTDVFLLGGILYAMLTGSPPHQLSKGSDTDAAKLRIGEIRSCSTIRPVVERRREAGLPETPEGLSESALSGLWSIAKQALSRDPADRFERVPAMEAALDEWESRSTSQELCVQAATRLKEVASQRRPSARGYAEVIALADASLGKWESNDEARRIRDDASSALATIQRRSSQRLWTAAAAIALVFVVGGIGYQRTRFQRNRAEDQKDKAERLAESEAEQRRQAVAAKQEAIAAEEQAKNERDSALREAYFANIALADQKIRDAQIGDAERVLDACPEQVRAWEWGRLKRLCNLDLMTLRGHRLPVESVAFSLDGKRILSGSWDKSVKVWDVETGLEIMTLEGHTDKVTSAAFSPDGKRIASGSEDSTVRMWDGETGREIMAVGEHYGPVSSVAFSPDGKRVVSGSGDKTIKVWESETGREVMTMAGHTAPVVFVAFSPDGKRIVSASRDDTVKLWDATSGLEYMTLKGHAAAVTCVALARDGRRVASASWDRTVKVWDGETGRELTTLSGHRNVLSVAFSPDGTRLVSGGWDKAVRVWDVETGRELVTMDGHRFRVLSVAFSPDGRWVASGSFDASVKLWDGQRGREPMTLAEDARPVNCVAFSPDGARIASGSYRVLTLWDGETGRELMVLKGHTQMVASLSFSPDGDRIASACADRTVKVWDGETGRRMMTLHGHRLPVASVAFSPGGERLVSGSWDKTVKVWDVTAGIELMTLKGHTDTVRSVRWSPDGKHIASASDDKALKIWDANDGREVTTFRGHRFGVRCVAFSADSRQIAAGSWGSVKVWDGETDCELMTMGGHTDLVNSLAFSPDGKRIVSGSNDCTVKVWDGETGREIITLRGHSQAVASVAFSPDGKRIVSGSMDRTVKVWDSRSVPSATQFLAGAREGEASALCRLALIREGERRDAEARELHLRVVAMTDVADRKWAALSRRRLKHVPWLQLWWQPYEEAESCFVAGRLDAGMAAYREAHGLSADERELLSRKLAERLVGLAESRLKQKNEQAERVCRLAIQLAPSSAAVHRMAAYVFRKLKLYDDAIRCCTKAMELEPDSAESKTALASVLNSQAWERLTREGATEADAKRALPMAEQAVKLSERKRAYILDTLAFAYFKTGSVAQAVKTQEEAIALLEGGKKHKDYAEYTKRLAEFRAADRKAGPE